MDMQALFDYWNHSHPPSANPLLNRRIPLYHPHTTHPPTSIETIITHYQPLFIFTHIYMNLIYLTTTLPRVYQAYTTNQFSLKEHSYDLLFDPLFNICAIISVNRIFHHVLRWRRRGILSVREYLRDHPSALCPASSGKRCGCTPPEALQFYPAGTDGKRIFLYLDPTAYDDFWTMMSFCWVFKSVVLAGYWGYLAVGLGSGENWGFFRWALPVYVVGIWVLSAGHFWWRNRFLVVFVGFRKRGGVHDGQGGQVGGSGLRGGNPGRSGRGGRCGMGGRNVY